MKDTLIEFQIYLNDKGLINNYDWDFEKEAETFIKKMLNLKNVNFKTNFMTHTNTPEASKRNIAKQLL